MLKAAKNGQAAIICRLRRKETISDINNIRKEQVLPTTKPKKLSIDEILSVSIWHAIDERRVCQLTKRSPLRSRVTLVGLVAQLPIVLKETRPQAQVNPSTAFPHSLSIDPHDVG